MTQCHIQEDMSPQKKCCKNLRSSQNSVTYSGSVQGEGETWLLRLKSGGDYKEHWKT
jgi:hypothetical protein